MITDKPATTHLAEEIEWVETFGFKVFSDNLDKIPLGKSCLLVNTISPNSYGISTEDPIFRKALKETDYLVLDGVYFALSSFLLQGKTIKKNQGQEVFDFFMQKLNTQQGRVFFLGASENTLAKIKARALKEYPDITLGFYSPPYKSSFNESENEEMLARINSFKPDALFLGMTAPKQEKWAYEHKNRLSAKLAISIGGVFDWYAGNEKKVAPIWWKLRLGWLVRTIQRPEILKRYPHIFIFFKHLFFALCGNKKYKYGKF